VWLETFFLGMRSGVGATSNKLPHRDGEGETGDKKDEKNPALVLTYGSVES
jgi:hypothetical protein